MKKLLLPFLALALLLSACGSGVTATPSPTAAETPSPSVTETPATTASPAPPERSGVFADWSKLESFAPVEEKYTRASAEFIDSLIPSDDYGLLLPLKTHDLYESGSSWAIGSKTGLVTQSGKIVLDPVCSSISRAVYYGAVSPYITQDIYVLARTMEDPAAADSVYYQGYGTRYAFAALDGSWCTDFIFTSTHGTEYGVMGVLDGEKGHVIGYDEAGRVVLDTREWECLSAFESYSAYNLAYLTADSPAPMRLRSGSYAFVNIKGEMFALTDLSIEHAFNFYGELAAVQIGGKYGFINREGELTVAPQYDQIVNFGAGPIMVSKGEVYYTLDEQGRELHRWDEPVYVCTLPDGGWCYVDNSWTRCYDQAFQPVSIAGSYEVSPSNDLGMYHVDDRGITVLWEGEELFFENATIASRHGDIFFLWYEDSYSHCAAVDREGSILLETLNGGVLSLTDRVTGEKHLALDDYDAGSRSVYSLSGELLVTQADFQDPVNGLFACRDYLSTGYKNADNEWVIRIRRDDSD